MWTFFFRDLNQDNVFPNLAHTVPGNDKLTFSAPEAAESARTGYDQCCDLPISFIKFKVDRASETPAGTDIYDFLLF